MRHRIAHRKLGRVTEHRTALLRNQAQALLRHEHISTTVAKAKELRPFVERLITIAKRGVSDGRGAGASGLDETRTLNARRRVMQDVQDREIVRKLFDTIAPRFVGRPGGYTRLLRLGFRRGDAAEVAQVELVGSEFNPRAKAETAPPAQGAAPGKPKGVGGRLRQAAQRLRGKKEESARPEEKAPKRTTAQGAGGAKPRPKKQGPRGS
jgi:large subunit ribosomal protein L17